MRLRIVALLALLAAGLPAQERYVVGVADFPPHVLIEDGEVNGFDVDLWREIANAAGFEYDLAPMPFSQLLRALQQGEIDAALGGITINAEREARIDFSHAYMQSGLRILTTVEEGGGFVDMLQGAASSVAGQSFLYLLGFLLLCAHLLWLAERKNGAVAHAYLPGVLEAGWCMLATITTVGYGDVAPKRWPGRLVAFAVMVIGIGLFGVLVAQIPAGLTLQELRAGIQTPEDLAGKLVATVEGSTSVAMARSYGARVRGTEDLAGAVEAVVQGSAQAVVFDGPPLLHFISQRPEAPVAVVGARLNSESYGIAFPDGSDLRETVNRVLLDLQENGGYERLYERWFGVQP